MEQKGRRQSSEPRGLATPCSWLGRILDSQRRYFLSDMTQTHQPHSSMSTRLLPLLISVELASAYLLAQSVRVPTQFPPALSWNAPGLLRAPRTAGQIVKGEAMSASNESGPESGKCSIPAPKTLRNVYFGIRHGQSENNIEAIISSDPAIGVPQHPLTALGTEQESLTANPPLTARLPGRARMSASP